MKNLTATLSRKDKISFLVFPAGTKTQDADVKHSGACLLGEIVSIELLSDYCGLWTTTGIDPDM